jgi:pimeloyl-[acyl-carrier protein] methyl ester esterase
VTGLYVERLGAGGLPLVCLHGWGMNLRVFDALRDRLAPQREVMLVDLPGHGASDWQASDEAFEAQCARIAAVLPPRCAVLGWSLGAQMALWLAHQQPSRVQRLVVVAGTPRFVSDEEWPHGVAPAVMHRFAVQLESDWQATVQEFLQLQLRGSREAGPALRWLQDALARHGAASRPALGAGLRFLRDNDLRHLCAAIAQPSLVVAGQHDRITPAAAAGWLALNVGQGRHVEIPRAGHVPQLSHVETLCDALEEFLADA